MQGNKFAAAPPGLNRMRRLDPRTKLCLLLASLVMVLVSEVFATAMRVKEAQAARDWLALAVAGILLAGAITLHLLGWDRISGIGGLTPIGVRSDNYCRGGPVCPP
jgi:hypothetical protein